MTASGRGWPDRACLTFVLVGAAVAVLKLGVLLAHGPAHGVAVGGIAEGRDFRAHVFGPLRPGDIVRLRSLLHAGDRFYIPALSASHDPTNTIGSATSLLGFSLLPNIMVGRLDEADVVIRVGDAPLPRALTRRPAERIRPGLEVLRTAQ